MAQSFDQLAGPQSEMFRGGFGGTLGIPPENRPNPAGLVPPPAGDPDPNPEKEVSLIVFAGGGGGWWRFIHLCYIYI